MRGMWTHSIQTHLNLSEGLHDKYSKRVECCVRLQTLEALLWHTIKSPLITFLCEQLYPTFQSHCRQPVFYSHTPCFHDTEQWCESCGGDSIMMYPFDFPELQTSLLLCSFLKLAQLKCGYLYHIFVSKHHYNLRNFKGMTMSINFLFWSTCSCFTRA